MSDDTASAASEDTAGEPTDGGPTPRGPNVGNQRVDEIYRRGMFDGEPPTFPIDHEAVREAAWEAMDERGRAYVHGGAGGESTFERNQDFSAWRIVPRMLRGIADRSLSVELLGQQFDWPIAYTPLGVQSLLHEEAERGTARAARELGVPMILSSLSSTPMEVVADELGSTPKWFQLYWSSDERVTASFVDRAEAAGYDAIVLTVDAPTLGWRERLVERGYYPFMEGEGIANYLTDPAFRDRLDDPPETEWDVNLGGGDEPTASVGEADGGVASAGETNAGETNAGGTDTANGAMREAVEEFLDVFGEPSLTWADLSWLTERTDLPVIVKGVLHPGDARRAVRAGADAVGVSTHGGRVVDGSITALEALPAVADAVGSEVPICFDSGLRRGHEAFVAYALGADLCLLGRPYAYGLAMGGQAGVEHVTRNLLAELDLTMGLAGHDSITSIDRESLRHAQSLAPSE